MDVSERQLKSSAAFLSPRIEEALHDQTQVVAPPPIATVHLPRISVLFLISSLNRGGAERQLTLLVQAMDKRRFDVTVVTVYDGGALRGAIAGLEGVEILSLRKQGRGDYIRPLRRLWRILRHKKPLIVHGYMDVANELALLFGKLIGAKVVWGIRSSNVDLSYVDRVSAWHFRASSALSRFADAFIANSHAGKDRYVADGDAGDRTIVIPNGFDGERFWPNHALGQRMRETWGIPSEAIVVGLVARITPVKDHPTFLRAAALLAAERPNVWFVCVGGGTEAYTAELRRLGDSLGISDRLVWTGEMGNTAAAHNAFDIATLTSTSEGFPNAVGEAMACGVPCVVTDVGDSALLVGDTGLVVPPGDPAAIAAAWGSLLDRSEDGRAALGRAARQRIVSEFGLEILARRTEAALTRLVA